jgi:hypothetical protein
MSGEGMGGSWGLVVIYYLVRYWKAWAVLVPSALIGLGYFLGTS